MTNIVRQIQLRKIWLSNSIQIKICKNVNFLPTRYYYEVYQPDRDCATTGRECATTGRDCATTGRDCATTGRDHATTGRDCATTGSLQGLRHHWQGLRHHLQELRHLWQELHGSLFSLKSRAEVQFICSPTVGRDPLFGSPSIYSASQHFVFAACISILYG